MSTPIGPRPGPKPEASAEGSELVNGDRQKAYGHPRKNFAVIAALWSAFLETDISPGDAALMMHLLKVARLRTGGPHRDSLVDAHGYLDVYELIEEPEGLT